MAPTVAKSHHTSRSSVPPPTVAKSHHTSRSSVPLRDHEGHQTAPCTKIQEMPATIWSPYAREAASLRLEAPDRPLDPEARP
uniref:Uncharacterized protein n=1 Tax=Aegilops tauschii TaxID=37682 RepID=M8BHA1_AEGTA